MHVIRLSSPVVLLLEPAMFAGGEVAGPFSGGREMPVPIDSQDLRISSNAQANSADQPTAAQRRVRDLLSSTSTHRDQLLTWIAQSLARSLAQDADQPTKGQNRAQK